MYFQVFKQQVIRHVKKLEVSKVLAPFGRRITALTWHPTLIATLAVGSKWGDIVVWNHDRPSHDQIVNRVNYYSLLYNMFILYSML